MLRFLVCLFACLVSISAHAWPNGSSAPAAGQASSFLDLGDELPTGLREVISGKAVSITVDELVDALDRHGMPLIAELDYAERAWYAQRGMKPARLLVFGNPRTVVALVNEEKRLGLELPLRFMVYEDEAGHTRITWNAPSWLSGRHDVYGPAVLLERLDAILEEVVEEVATPIEAAPAPAPRRVDPIEERERRRNILTAAVERW